MSFFGKTYVHEKDENYDPFIKSLNLPEDRAKALAAFKPTIKLEKNGDEYTLSLLQSGVDKTFVFKSGVSFDKVILNGEFTTKNILTVSGNVLQQVQDFGENRVISRKMEFSDKELVQTVTSSSWDGSARRYFTAS